MAKTKKSRKFGECLTVEDLIKELRKNFDPKDNVAILTIMTVNKDAKIDVENNTTIGNGMNITNISYSLSYIQKKRNEANGETEEKQD